MPRAKKTIPQDRGFYFSESEYMENAANNMYRIHLYARTDAGFWYANGIQIDDSSVPGDLWRVRMVQK